MGSVHARGDTFLTFGLKALTETNTSRLATATLTLKLKEKVWDKIFTVVFNNKVLNNAYNINYIIKIKYYFLLLSILLLFSKKQTLKTIYFSVTVSDVWIHFCD
jgi:hypothetical protein